jgi:hypothetical protein
VPEMSAAESFSQSSTANPYNSCRQRARSQFPTCPVFSCLSSAYCSASVRTNIRAHNNPYPQQNTPSGTREHLSAEETTGAARSAAANRPPAHVSAAAPWQPSPTNP